MYIFAVRSALASCNGLARTIAERSIYRSGIHQGMMAILAKLPLTADLPFSQMQQAIAVKCGWEPVVGLLRLEGFQEPWEKAVYRGRELKPGQTLEAAGLQGGAVITAVRKVLVAEGWKVSCTSHSHLSV